MNFDYKLHEAEIESVVIGPRGEIRLALALGSACISDRKLPEAATLRMGGIVNFAEIRQFLARFVPDPIARIDCLTVLPGTGALFNVGLEIYPQGFVEMVCSKLEVLPSETI